MPIDDAQARRLFCAALLSYPASVVRLTPAQMNERLAALGYQPGLQAFYGGPPQFLTSRPGDAFAQREGATLGVTAHEVIVAFRGTLPPDFANQGLAGVDWLNNTKAGQVAVPGVAGRCHEGFAGAVDTVWASLKTALAAAAAAHPALPVCFTGHSKGGAMAFIAAARWRAEGGAKPRVCAFAAARAGNPAFARAVEGGCEDIRRYEYGPDIVPHLPPSTSVVAQLLRMAPAAVAGLPDYASAGQLWFLPTLAPGAPKSGQPVRPANAFEQFAQDGAWLAEVAQLIRYPVPTKNLSDLWVAQAHGIGPGSGYDRWLY